MSNSANIAGLAIFDVPDFLLLAVLLPRFQCKEIVTVVVASLFTYVVAATAFSLL